ncbi:branched-chain alpha-ketoacid dehydrogenase kinase [Phakopsora pachyrhizi]|uniref:Protein-serine/threonine kinase n=1 Tax=Phakopsora pachyrhizi TaxID=170000 RepID=A0AAV0AUA5_PHAPC|nr:branched-chain alpha-ketoacid dehydrogenase kinase [Phakopsora pachyrhizi]
MKVFAEMNLVSPFESMMVRRNNLLYRLSSSHYSSIISHRRFYTPPIKFYDNSHILRYSEMELAPFSLRQLIFFGKILSSHGSNPKEIEKTLIQGANFVQSQLPTRIARRIRDFQQLPFVVASNIHLMETYNLYVEAFEKIRSFPKVTNRDRNQEWCRFLGDLLKEHRVVIPQLAIGIAETADHLTNHQIEKFMTIMFHSRICRRVLAEHHIALTSHEENLGVIETRLEVGKVLERCIELVKSNIQSQSDGTVLLNSFRAAIDYSSRNLPTLSNFKIKIHIASSPVIFFHLAERKERIRGLTQVGGLEGKVREHVRVDQNSSLTHEAEEIQEARLRIGLPLSSIYAQFLGGSLEMFSIKGYSDVVLSIPKLGTITEPKPMN